MNSGAPSRAPRRAGPWRLLCATVPQLWRVARAAFRRRLITEEHVYLLRTQRDGYAAKLIAAEARNRLLCEQLRTLTLLAPASAELLYSAEGIRELLQWRRHLQRTPPPKRLDYQI